MEVHPSVPAKTVAEFVAYAKQNPGKLNFGSAGTGGTVHLAGEMFKQMAGVDMVHVAYKGAGPALTDLISGNIQLMFDTVGTALPPVQGGLLRALAVSSAQRLGGAARRCRPWPRAAIPTTASASGTALPHTRSVPDDVARKAHARASTSALSDDVFRASLDKVGFTPLRPRSSGRDRSIHRRRSRALGARDQVSQHFTGLRHGGGKRR